MSSAAYRALVSTALVTIAGTGLWRSLPESHRAPPGCPHPVGVVGPDGRAVVVCLATARGSLAQVLERGGVDGCPRGAGHSRPVVAGSMVRIDTKCSPTIEPLPAHQRILLGRPIDLNRASAEELTALPRVGPVLSRRIVEERRRAGPFVAIDDLTRVKGIGPRTVERLRPLVTTR